MFAKIKKWYEQGLWTAQMVLQAHAKGVLTAAQLHELGL